LYFSIKVSYFSISATLFHLDQFALFKFKFTKFKKKNDLILSSLSPCNFNTVIYDTPHIFFSTSAARHCSILIAAPACVRFQTLY
jgi:hypothetical protein